MSDEKRAESSGREEEHGLAPEMIDAMLKSTRTVFHVSESFLERLRNTLPHQLPELLQEMPPMRIANVLYFMQPNKAYAVLEAFGDDLQTEVAWQIALINHLNDLNETDKAIVQELSGGEDRSDISGAETLAEILKGGDLETEKRIVEFLEENDPDLAERVKEKLFWFEDIILFDDSALRRLLQDVDAFELAVLLRLAEPALRQSIERNLSEEMTRVVREKKQALPPSDSFTPAEIKAFKVRIVETAQRLNKAGEIIVVRNEEL